MPLNGNTGQSGQSDTAENVADIENQFRRLKGDYALNVAHIKGEIHALVNHEQFVDIWAHVRKIEKRFHVMQGDYDVRTSKMQAVTARCKRQMQRSIVSRYSNVNTGGSLLAPRYSDDRGSGCDPTLTANMHGNIGDVICGSHENNAVASGTAQYLYATSELIPLAPLMPMSADYLYLPEEPLVPPGPLMAIGPDAIQHVPDTIEPHAYQQVHDTRKSLKRTFDRI